MAKEKLFNDQGLTKWILVNSSNLYAVRYDKNNRILSVQFGNPTPISQYDYKNVSLSQFTALIQAPSHGHWFAVNIRNNTINYPYTKVKLENIDETNSRWNFGEISNTIK